MSLSKQQTKDNLNTVWGIPQVEYYAASKMGGDLRKLTEKAVFSADSCQTETSLHRCCSASFLLCLNVLPCVCSWNRKQMVFFRSRLHPFVTLITPSGCIGFTACFSAYRWRGYCFLLAPYDWWKNELRVLAWAHNSKTIRQEPLFVPQKHCF